MYFKGVIKKIVTLRDIACAYKRSINKKLKYL